MQSFLAHKSAGIALLSGCFKRVYNAPCYCHYLRAGFLRQDAGGPGSQDALHCLAVLKSSRAVPLPIRLRSAQGPMVHSLLINPTNRYETPLQQRR